MIYIGDVHAQFDAYEALTLVYNESIQVGDFGVGFREVPKVGEMHRFIRGNHDDPGLCLKTPGYMGDFGADGEIFWAGGGYSIDRQYRTPGVNWWAGEQLGVSQMKKAFSLFTKAKPRVVVTHQCPGSVEDELFDFPTKYPNLTTAWLDTLFDAYRPEVWVFGHYHISRDQEIKGTRFVCLRPMEVKEL